MFAPLLMVAIEMRMPIIAGDPPRALVSKVAKEGLGALPAGERTRLNLDAPLAPALQDALLSELEASHCGLIPKARFTNMALAQRYRDAHLAAALADAGAKTGSAVLLAGNGHARLDRGVPSLFGSKGLRGDVISIQLVEVEDGKSDPSAYMPKDPDGYSAAEIIIFTPRHVREDPCLEMKKQFSKPK